MTTLQPITVRLPDELPPSATFQAGIRRAPKRGPKLSPAEKVLAVKNALRYIPPQHHEVMAAEFLAELEEHGRIYGYRYRPQGRIYGRPISEYEGCVAARALQVNIDNNLDLDVALYPYELVTYGETGQVFQNWMQYRLVTAYLRIMREDQTLVVMSGHPLGLFPSHPLAPRVVSTNAALVGLWDNGTDFNRLAALGVTNYGQMTAGGWIYIGPQGIVHGTYITLLNAARLYLDVPEDQNLAGITFVTSGLGGMSGAQAKAVEIAGGVGIIAEVDMSRIQTRYEQGWVSKYSNDLPTVLQWMQRARDAREALSIAYHGNVVDLLEYLDEHGVKVDLLSDQTSCHVVYDGGYTPADLTHEQGRDLLAADSDTFRIRVDESLRRHYQVIKRLVTHGARFWDYGNSFMAAVFDAGVCEIARNGCNTDDGFIWPSYVEDIMGPICFDRGFGPFRWVCTSHDPADLIATDRAAMELIDPSLSALHRDNWQWIRDAGQNRLTVGTLCRILYSDEEGRMNIALKFNQMVRDGEIGPITIGRDHHDCMGTDSPFRETADINDGSRFTADMAEHNALGNSRHGMTLVVRSDGGGVGVGRAVNCGYALVLDGSERVDQIIRMGVSFDVIGGVARRSWSRNPNAIEVALAWNEKHAGEGQITMPRPVEDGLVETLVGC